MYRQMKIEEETKTSGGYTVNENAMAGTILKYIGSYFLILNSNTWITNFSASKHMRYKSNSLTSMSS